jgi:N-acetylglutamate synthase-like GNAT family acetyltransferase
MPKERFKFILKKDENLSREDKEEMHNLLVATYPKFKKLFDKHGYYSTVKPQMNFLVKRNKELVGTGKFLWKSIKFNKETIKLFAFGVVIKRNYQGKGLGTHLTKLDIKEAKKRGGDILYASASTKRAENMISKLGFKRIIAKVLYKDVLSKKIVEEKNPVYVFEFKKCLLKKLNSLPKFYIGLGPI